MTQKKKTKVYLLVYQDEMEEDADVYNQVLGVFKTLKSAQAKAATWIPEYKDGKPFTSDKQKLCWVHGGQDEGIYQEVIQIQEYPLE